MYLRLLTISKEKIRKERGRKKEGRSEGGKGRKERGGQGRNKGLNSYTKKASLAYILVVGVVSYKASSEVLYTTYHCSTP